MVVKPNQELEEFADRIEGMVKISIAELRHGEIDMTTFNKGIAILLDMFEKAWGFAPDINEHGEVIIDYGKIVQGNLIPYLPYDDPDYEPDCVIYEE